MSASSNDRFSRCTFTFVDGRRCRMLRFADHLHYCHHHALKEAQVLAAEKLGQDMTCYFAGRHFSTCDLAAALTRLLEAAASGLIKPGTASTLAFLAQTLLQTLNLAEQESSPSNDVAAPQHIPDSVNRASSTRTSCTGERFTSPAQLPSPGLPAPSRVASACWPGSESSPVTPLE